MKRLWAVETLLQLERFAGPEPRAARLVDQSLTYRSTGAYYLP